MTHTILHRITAAAGLTALLTGVAAAASTTPLSGVHGRLKTLTTAADLTADRAATPGAVSADKKTLTFRRRAIRLVAHSGPPSDMLSYRIDGLRNPTLVVPAGATLQVLFVNTDDDMSHNLRFGFRHASSAPSIGTSDLAHKTGAALHAEEATVRFPAASGTYYYFCTIPGHAQGGMWGTVLVR